MKNFILFIFTFFVIYILLRITTENYDSINNKWSNYYECKNNQHLKNWIVNSNDSKNDCKKYLNNNNNNNNNIISNNTSYSKKNLKYLVRNYNDLKPIYNIFNTEKITPYYNHNDNFYHNMSLINQCKNNPFLVSWKNNIDSISCKKFYK